MTYIVIMYTHTFGYSHHIPLYIIIRFKPTQTFHSPMPTKAPNISQRTIKAIPFAEEWILSKRDVTTMFFLVGFTKLRRPFFVILGIAMWFVFCDVLGVGVTFTHWALSRSSACVIEIWECWQLALIPSICSWSRVGTSYTFSDLAKSILS